MFAKFLLAAIALQAFLVSADPGPTVPGPGDSYKEGGDCVIEWTADSSGQWTDMQIELKTGNNLAMVPLKVITTIDATKQTQFIYPCPDVTPNSAIYFYEFTSASSTTKYWTTRFTITDENGNSTPPTESTQPNGDKIAWGTGNLLSDSGSGGSEPGSSPSPDPSSPDPSSPDPSSPGPSSPSPSPSPLDSSSTQTKNNGFSTSTSRSTSPSAPPSQTGSNNGTSQNNSARDIAVSIPKALVFVIGLVTASTFL